MTGGPVACMMKTYGLKMRERIKDEMSSKKRFLRPVSAGLMGAALLIGLYFGIVSWAESPQHAIELFWQDRWITIPITLGFGVQAALYTLLKLRLFVPVRRI